MRASLRGVEFPFDLEEFATPGRPRVFRLYPEWAKAVAKREAEGL